MCELPLMYRDGERNIVIDKKNGMTDLCTPYVMLFEDTITVNTGSFLIKFEGEEWQIHCFRPSVSHEVRIARLHFCLSNLPWWRWR